MTSVICESFYCDNEGYTQALACAKHVLDSNSFSLLDSLRTLCVYCSNQFS